MLSRTHHAACTRFPLPRSGKKATSRTAGAALKNTLARLLLLALSLALSPLGAGTMSPVAAQDRASPPAFLPITAGSDAEALENARLHALIPALDRLLPMGEALASPPQRAAEGEAFGIPAAAPRFTPVSMPVAAPTLAVAPMSLPSPLPSEPPPPLLAPPPDAPPPTPPEAPPSVRRVVLSVPVAANTPAYRAAPPPPAAAPEPAQPLPAAKFPIPTTGWTPDLPVAAAAVPSLAGLPPPGVVSAVAPLPVAPVIPPVPAYGAVGGGSFAPDAVSAASSVSTPTPVPALPGGMPGRLTLAEMTAQSPASFGWSSKYASPAAEPFRRSLGGIDGATDDLVHIPPVHEIPEASPEAPARPAPILPGGWNGAASPDTAANGTDLASAAADGAMTTDADGMAGAVDTQRRSDPRLARMAAGNGKPVTRVFASGFDPRRARPRQAATEEASLAPVDTDTAAGPMRQAGIAVVPASPSLAQALPRADAPRRSVLELGSQSATLRMTTRHADDADDRTNAARLDERTRQAALTEASVVPVAPAKATPPAANAAGRPTAAEASDAEKAFAAWMSAPSGGGDTFVSEGFVVPSGR